MRAKKDAERQGEMKYEQLDIFSFAQPRQAEEPPILLSKGQEVYLVNKGDVIKCTVCDDENSWICGGNNRGYRLVTEGGGYDCTWNSAILGKEAFTNYDSAKAKANEYLKTHDGIILAANIKPINTVAYSCVRDCGNGEKIAFYCDLGNDMYYLSEFTTYHHICKGKKAVRKFMGQQAFKYNNPKEISGFITVFKNMYKCTEQSDWDYAECSYVYAVGERI